MKYIFIMNPAAGQGKAEELPKEIAAVCDTAGIEYEIYWTTGPGDGEAYVRDCCQAHARDYDETKPAAVNPAEETLRFYACGGDGMLSEVVNGAAGFAFAEIGCIPLGTGNDFVRNFPEADFTDLIGQVRGKSVPCDLIRYEGICGGTPTARYCVNMFNIGFDCNVVDLTDRLKQLPLINGTAAYLGGVAGTLIRKKGADLRVEYESGFVHDGPLLLCSVSNGCYCGGGIKGLPRAVTDDGMMDVSLIKDVPRRTFLRLFPKYMKGTHLGERRLQGVVRYTQEQKLVISPNGDPMKLCVDGDITTSETIRLEICPKAFRFVVPAEKK